MVHDTLAVVQVDFRMEGVLLTIIHPQKPLTRRNLVRSSDYIVVSYCQVIRVDLKL
jgi:hypothetical protein